MAEESFIIKLKTLTPIWTGNALGGCDEIKESGIIGSIRWWYEIVSRSLGKRVCNPTQQSKDGKCELKREEFINSILQEKTVDAALNKQICSVCKLFGCNGWSSKFGLIVKDENGNDVATNLYIKGRNFKQAKRMIKGKIFDEKSPLILEFYPLKEVADEEWEILIFVLKLISEWAALGGKTAQGNGVVEIINKLNSFTTSNNKLSALWDFFFKNNELPDLKDSPFINNKLPDLRHFFFTKCRLKFNENILNMESDFWIEKFENKNNQYRNKNTKYIGLKNLWNDYKFIPIGFHIRDTIRRIEENKFQRHNLFGERQRGSKIFVSHGYKINDNTVEFRIWGYGVGKDKKGFIKKLEKSIKDNLQDYLFKEKSRNKYSIDFTIYSSKYIDNFRGLKEEVN